MRRIADGFNEHLALDHRAGRRPAAVGGRGKISELMGDFAKGIKSFKKGMSEEDKTEADPPKTEPVKTIDHQPPPTSAGATAAALQAETRKVG